VKAGAGEILLTSVEREGTLGGMDMQLIADASAMVDVPLIASGGAGSLADIQSAVKAGASAVAAGAFFVFHGPHRAVLITYPRYDELRRLWEEAK
jgi:cyclase